MRKLLIVLGSLFGLLVLAAIVIPLVVDVDKYRPQIVQAANERINGKLELGKLSLSLWGKIRVEIAGLKLQDATGRELVAVSDAYFHVPFSSIFAGSPLLTLSMTRPSVNVVKDAQGNINLLNLIKESPADSTGGSSAGVPSASEEGDQAAPSGQPTAQKEVPAIVTRARLGVRIEDATVTYKDLATGADTQVQNLNLVVQDLSLTRPTELELWANVDTTIADKEGGKPMTVKGPARLTARSELLGGKLDEIKLQLKVDLDKLAIGVPGAFQKSDSVPANLDGTFMITPKLARIDALQLVFHVLKLSASGEVNRADTPLVSLNAEASEIPLAPWTELLPAMKDFNLGGMASFKAEAKGPADKLDYRADLAVKSLTAKAPKLKAQPQFDATIQILTDRIENFSVTMKAPANDLKMTGKLVSFTRPRLEAQLTSTGMDLDQLIEFPPPASQAAATGKPASGAAAGGAGAGGPGAAAPSQGKSAGPNFDAMLDPLRGNDMAAAASGVVNFNLRSLKAYEVPMTDIQGKLTLQDLNAALDYGMKLWDGSIKLSASTALKPKTPTYRFNAEMNGLQLQKAVTSQMQMLKNTVVGKATFKMDGSGSSFNPDPAMRNLNTKGTMRIDNAKFASIDVGKMAHEAVTKAVDRVAEKVPALKGKTIKTPPPRESKYEYISSDFTIGGGKFMAPNFVAKAMPNDGIDLNGDTTLGMLDYSLAARWLVIDTYNFTHAKDLSVSQMGVNVDHVLAEKNGPVKFPVTIGGTVFQPTYSYAEVPEYLAKVALNNVAGAAKGKVQAEAQKKIQDAIQKQAPPQVQDKLKDLGKKLFGR